LVTYFEDRAIYLFNICCYDMKQWRLFFTIQWTITTLQLMRFLSNAYIQYNWTSDVAEVFMQIADFVTEIPFASAFTAYIISASICLGCIAFAVFTALSHHFYQWVVPIILMRYILFWFPVIYFPLVIPHLKMILSCFSYTIESYTIHPFYENVTCWSGAHGGYFGLSIVVATILCVSQYLIISCFYDSEMPSGTSLAAHSYVARYTALSDSMMFVMKTILLILYIGGHTPSWRYAMGFLTFLSGLAAAAHLLYTMPHWHDTALLLYTFQALLLSWTGVTAVLMTALDDTEGTGMLYFVMLPVLLIAAQMAMQWRIRVVGELSARELTNGTLIITKIRYYARVYFQWLAQFGDIYIEESEAQTRELMSCFALVEDTLEAGLRRFPDNTDLHIYTTQFFRRQSQPRARLSFAESGRERSEPNS